MNNLTIDDIIDGMIKVTLNAQSLVDEAELLSQNKYYARAYTLAHIAREEISKLYILFKVGIEVIAGKKYDYKKLQKRFNNHKSKIQFFSVPYYIDSLNGKYVVGLNKRKNDSLYVGYEQNKFQSPSDAITKHVANRTIELAITTILKLTNVHKIIESLIYWKEAPKEKFNKAFKNIIFKTNEEILNEMPYDKVIQLAQYVEEKSFEKYNENIVKLKDAK